MPLRFARKEKNAFFTGLWITAETEEWFLRRLGNGISAEMEAGFPPVRRLEALSTRYLLHVLSGLPERAPCVKDLFGKPYLEGQETRISISHSGPLAAIILSPDAVGVDVQQWDPRMERLAPRFCHEEEILFAHGKDSLQMQHVLWGAKEAMYKAHGRKRLDFRDHLLCDRFDWNPAGGNFDARILEPDTPPWLFQGYYRPFAEGMLVWVVEKAPIFVS